MAYTIQKLRLAKDALLGISSFVSLEARHGRLGKTLSSLLSEKPWDIAWSDLLEDCDADVPDKAFLHYKDETFTYRQMNANANRMANFLLAAGGGRGSGVGILMRNSPRVLDVFFGSQKAGMYSVMINPELKGDGLVYVINHSDIGFLVTDAELLDTLTPVMGSLERVKPSALFINDIEEEARGIEVPDTMGRLSRAYQMPAGRPDIRYNLNDLCLIIYTSGTTGPPKGVVYRYKTTGVNRLRLVGHLFLKKEDIYYTYLSLCHGNALFISTTATMAARAGMALARKFSASRFWDDVRRHNATVFNTIGSIVPILMKQPAKPTDSQNNVRVVFSAACPADMWEPFERRFGVTLYEGYGAIDGGGKGIMNFGTAPRGSLGKPLASGKVRLVDENGNDVSAGAAGELLFKVGGGKSRVEYYKNEAAAEKKVKNGWLYTGDILRKDKNGYFYFVGRNTESMRKGGENVSAYEVEHVIMKHPAVEDVAVYAVPSEMAEDEIMAAVKLVEGQPVAPADLRAFLVEHLAKYAVPRYIRFVKEFPKTNTHRIIKRILEKEGVTPDTYDALNP
ncbi:MAG: AMP-binding protein [Thermodesulfobacteriota bacterium]